MGSIIMFSRLVKFKKALIRKIIQTMQIFKNQTIVTAFSYNQFDHNIYRYVSFLVLKFNKIDDG